MGLNYFELFELEPTFNVDEVALRKKFYQKSMQFHPDKIVLSNDKEKDLSLQKATLINQAFKVLSDEELRMKYLLELSGIDFAEGKETVPQDFLMEVMEINEMIMDYKMESKRELKNSIIKQITTLKSNLLNNIDDILSNYEYQKADKKQLEFIKDYYLKAKYLKRIELNLEN